MVYAKLEQTQYENSQKDVYPTVMTIKWSFIMSIINTAEINNVTYISGRQY